MFLKALEVQGFKSFPQKTKIEIGTGVTAIVGPNGSGKSNLSDAIRWVLGEVSAKQLRGGTKMEHVIFGGTKMRSAMGAAVVRLYLDNKDRRIDVQEDEVVITRKYDRSGESEYTLNGRIVRLKDIYELLLDTGLGKDGYSLISQGQIAQIVSAKSEQRREIFEQAAGIAKFRYRKNEAEKRLQATQENLVRLEDMLQELKQRVIPLEKESKKAKQFLTLAQQKKQAEVTLWVQQLQQKKDDLRTSQRMFEQIQVQYDDVSCQMSDADKKAESQQLEIEEISCIVERLNQEIRTLSEEIAENHAKCAVLENDKKHGILTIEQRSQEIQQGEMLQDQLKQEWQLQCEDLEHQKQGLHVKQEAFQKIQKEMAQCKQQKDDEEKRIQKIEKELQESMKEHVQWQVETATSNSTVQAEHDRQHDAKTQMEKARLEYIQCAKEQKEVMQQYLYLQEQYREQEKAGALAVQNQEMQAQNMHKYQQEQQVLLYEKQLCQQRLSLLQDFEENLEGFQHSVKTVLKAAQKGRLSGVIGTVSSILQVKEGYELAIDTALGFAMQNLVVENEQAAKDAISFLKRQKAGRATFLPLTTIKAKPFICNKKLYESVQIAKDVVSYDPKYERIFSYLLGKILIVENLELAMQTAKLLEYQNRIVTKDGQVIHAGGSFTGGSSSHSTSFFSRKKEKQVLQKKQRELLEQYQQLHEQIQKQKALCLACEEKVLSVTKQHEEIKEKLLETGAHHSILQQQAQQMKERYETLCMQQQELQNRMEHDIVQRDYAQKKQADLNLRLQHLQQQLTAQQGVVDAILKQEQILTQQREKIHLELIAQEKDVEHISQKQTNTMHRIKEHKQRLDTYLQDVLEQTNKNHQTQETFLLLQKEMKEKQLQLEHNKEQMMKKAQERMHQQEALREQGKQMRSLAEHRETLARSITRLQEQKQIQQTEYEVLAGKLWQEYELSVADAQAQCVEFDSLTALHQRVVQLNEQIKALGYVHVGAMEEYVQVKERYDFLTGQVNDIEKSRKELLALIEQLAQEMKVLFQEKLACINLHFTEIFSLLFGGGTACLSLQNPKDVLSCGIDITVSPPGKKIKELASLSGGEQALVAISIYFAILAVNPAPFCVLDEIDAALDEVNVIRFAQYLRQICNNTQFLVITHRRGTMEQADVLYGVTMQEQGISKLLRLDLEKMDASMIYE